MTGFKKATDAVALRGKSLFSWLLLLLLLLPLAKSARSERHRLFCSTLRLCDVHILINFSRPFLGPCIVYMCKKKKPRNNSAHALSLNEQDCVAFVYILINFARPFFTYTICIPPFLALLLALCTVL